MRNAMGIGLGLLMALGLATTGIAAEEGERGRGAKDCGPLVPSAPKSGHVKVVGVKCKAGEKVIKRFFKQLDQIGDSAKVDGFDCTSGSAGKSHFRLVCVDGKRSARYRGYVSGE